MVLDKAFSSKTNVAASVGSSIWSALLSVAFVPIYLRFIGPEGYGLIGVFASLQAVVTLLDLGLSPTVNRELARMTAQGASEQELLDLKRTLELPNFLLALFIIGGLAVLAPLLANYWIVPKELPAETVQAGLFAAAFSIGIQFSVNFYNGALLGQQKQLVVAGLNITFGTARALLGTLVLVLTSGSIPAFILTQGVVWFLQLLVAAFLANRSLSRSKLRGGFRRELISDVWKFAAGMTSLSALGLIVSQTDKLILSKLLDLESFGFYALAVTISAMSVVTIAGAVNQAMFPRFCRLVSLPDEHQLAGLYHRSSQFVAVVLIPIVVILSVFSYEVLFLWTQNERIAENAHLLLVCCVVGSGLQGVLYLAHSLQLAHGWTRLSLYLNLFAIIFIVPLMLVGVELYGALGGALGWLVMTSFFFIFEVTFMHRRLLIGERRKWLANTIFLPLVSALPVAMLGKMVWPSSLSRVSSIFVLGMIAVLTLSAAVFAAPASREYLSALWRSYFADRRRAT